MVDLVVSKQGVPIRLTDERWAHITEEHCELAGVAIRRADDRVSTGAYPAWRRWGAFGYP